LNSDAFSIVDSWSLGGEVVGEVGLDLAEQTVHRRSVCLDVGEDPHQLVEVSEYWANPRAAPPIS
jgi:hypothetical protein